MDGLIDFNDLGRQRRASDCDGRVAPDPQVLQLRKRLLDGGLGDSLEVRVALIAELVFRTYIHQLSQKGGRE